MEFSTINKNKVQQLAETLLQLPIAGDFSEKVVPEVRSDRSNALHAFLWASAICHATQGGISGVIRGKRLAGWDYLLAEFCAAAELIPEEIRCAKMKHIDAEKLKYLLVIGADSAKVDLPDLDRRSELLREIATQLGEMYEGGIVTMLDLSKNRVGGSGGAYERLATLKGFDDALKKKSSVFLTTAHFSGCWRIDDQQSVEPMVDYHLMRQLCRLGCISINNAELRNRLNLRECVGNDVEQSLRHATAAIIHDLHKITGISIFELDTLIWAHARSCCRNKPICQSGEIENSSFFEYVALPNIGRCVFQDWCLGAQEPEIRGIWEPQVQTEAY